MPSKEASTKPRLSFLDQNNENGEASRFGVKEQGKERDTTFLQLRNRNVEDASAPERHTG
jgi:hypothetical protein